MSFTFKERQKINHQLNTAGLASLDNPRDLLSQIALGIRNDKQFRQLLLSVKPDKRTECYESLKPRLSFEAKPLADYISDAAQEAEAQKLPVWSESEQKFIAFDDYRKRPKSLHELAEQAIATKQKEDEAKQRLELVCRRCTFAEWFFGKDRIQPYKDARMKGWTFEKRDDKEQALCPKCSPKLLLN